MIYALIHEDLITPELKAQQTDKISNKVVVYRKIEGEEFGILMFDELPNVEVLFSGSVNEVKEYINTHQDEQQT